MSEDHVSLGFTPYSRQSSEVPAKKLMIWGCVRSNRERLIFPIKNKINADAYIDCLKNKVLPFLYFYQILQQDNAPAHAGKKGDVSFSKVLLHHWKLAPTISGFEYDQKCGAHFEKKMLSEEIFKRWNSFGLSLRKNFTEFQTSI